MEQFQIGCLLKMITDKIKMRADADLAQQGLTLTQSRVLGYLDRSGGQATQKEIEGFLQVSHPTVAGIINRMEQNGFVRCRLDPADKRSKIVSQTERAAAVAQDMHDPDNGAADAALADAGTDRGAGIGAAHDLCRSRLTGP